MARRGSSSHQFFQVGLDWFGQSSALTRRPRQPLLAYILLRITIPCAVVPSPVLHEMVTGVRLATRLTRRKVHIAAAGPYVPRRGSTAGPPGRLYAAEQRTNGADFLAPPPWLHIFLGGATTAQVRLPHDSAVKFPPRMLLFAGRHNTAFSCRRVAKGSPDKTASIERSTP